MELDVIYNEDCLVGMHRIPDKSIDLILCDLPYGMTQHKWDVIIPFDRLWKQYERIVKDDGVIALFSAEPFTSLLIQSNPNLFRYKWIWVKNKTGFLNVAYRPLKQFEEISVFSKATIGSLSVNPIRYNPQGAVEINKRKKNNPNCTWRASKGYLPTGNVLNSNKAYTQRFTNLPTDILYFNPDNKRLHPTQKPVDLLEYLIKTYTNENDVVLDNCFGSGSTLVAAANTNRRYIGFELEPKYFDIAKQRLHAIKQGFAQSHQALKYHNTTAA